MRPDIQHHLDPATLMAFSAGTLTETLSAVAAAHIEMCPQCRSELRDLDTVGAVLFENLQLTGGTGFSKPARLPSSGTVVELQPRRKAERPVRTLSALPEAFAARIGVDLANVRWRRLAPGIWHYPVKLSPGVRGDLRLLKIAAGKQMPEHGHGGTELTLVLAGSYHDDKGSYGCGDVQDIDGEQEHQPVAHPVDGCICVVASEQPARYKRLVHRLLQPLTGI